MTCIKDSRDLNECPITGLKIIQVTDSQDSSKVNENVDEVNDDEIDELEDDVEETEP